MNHGRRSWNAVLLVATAVAASLASLDVLPWQMASADGVARMAGYVAGFWPPDTHPDFLLQVAKGSWETLAMALAGTILAAFFGLLLAWPSSHAGGVGRLAKWVLNPLRAVPELVWAAFMVLAAGLGPMAGTLAIALHTTGVLGRLYAETLENAPSAAADALREAGARGWQVMIWGVLPVVLTRLVGYALYRAEMNIRAAAVLGFVGAGGLGQMLYVSLSLFQETRAATLIIATLFLVAAVETLGSQLRRRLDGT